MAKTYNNFNDLIDFTRASTATFLDSDGILKTASTNVPRIEYDADGNRLGLLVEESRTNLVDYSSYIDTSTSNWTSANITVNNNSASSPDGSYNGISLIETTATNVHSVYQTPLVTDKIVTASVYVKDNGRNYCQLRVASIGIGQAYVNFDLQNGVTGSSGGNRLLGSSIQSVGNDWYRISINIDGSGATIGFELCLVDGPNATERRTYSGDGTSGIYAYGFQFEVGSFLTSLIPTTGTTATRSADVASIDVTEFGYNQSEGTVVVEFKANDTSVTRRLIGIDNGSGNNRIDSTTSPSNSLGFYVVDGGSISANSTTTTTFTDGDFAKGAYSYQTNNFSICLDGGSVTSDTTGTVPTTNILRIGSSVVATNLMCGYFKSIKYYPRALTATQIQELTR